MIKKSLIAFSLLLTLVLTYGLNQLRLAHVDIDSIAPELPTLAAVHESGMVLGLPAHIAYFNTATQKVPRASLLDEAHDPLPLVRGEEFRGEEFRGEKARDEKDDETGNDKTMVNMSFPVFVATWEDGRQFVIDAGLSATEAIEFGRRSELAGSMPLEFHGLAADQLDLDKVKGIGLTHLHSDHTTGISAFCDAGADFALVQSMEQFSWHDYLTSDSATLINELTCGVQLILNDGLLLKGVRGFPGLYIVHVGGHTLGSQLFVLHINEGSSIGTYIIAGDMANHFDGINYNVSKPPAYSRWLVPENLDQLYKVRSWLKQMNQDTNITVLLSHDKAHLIESGLPEL
jgi:glyoxylase-like metal-dependent hydrolase (beta-lactamase superfamily II)